MSQHILDTGKSEGDGPERLVAMTPVVMLFSPYLLFMLASFCSCSTVNLPSPSDIRFQTGPEGESHVTYTQPHFLAECFLTVW